MEERDETKESALPEAASAENHEDAKAQAVAPAKTSRFDFRRLPPFHPILIAAFPVLSLYAHNQSNVDIHDLFAPLLAMIVVGAAVWALVGALARSIRAGALTASLFLTFLCLYGHLYSATENWFVFGFYLGSPRLTFVAWSVALTVGVYLCLNAGKALAPATAILNLVSIFLIVFPLISAARYEVGLHAVTQSNVPERTSKARKRNSPRPEPTAKPPNIYYIILDGFGRHDILKSIYHYDDSDFLGFLRDRGFYVADQSRSNYPQTYLSLCSSLNFSYLQDLADRQANGLLNDPLIISSLKNSEIARFLESRGYTFVAFKTGFSNTEIEDADVYLKPPPALTDFDYAVLDTTPIPTLFHYPLLHIQYGARRRQLLYILDNLGVIEEAPSPKFVFAHVIAPHPPFVFLADGSPVDPDRPYGLGDGTGWFGSREEYIASYAEQAQYIASRAMEAVDRILAHNSEPPIIVIQSDHGPGSTFDQYDYRITDLKERFSNLNAYLLPGGGEKRLFPDITPVDTFRVILNYYFQTRYEILPGRSYYLSAKPPYKSIDLTDEAIGGDGAGTSAFPRRRSGRSPASAPTTAPASAPAQ